MRLPQRLEAVLRQVPPGVVAADIGTGHGLLAAALAKREPGGPVIATEVAQQPLTEARRVCATEVPGRVDLRVGWGLEPLTPGEAEVLILAGMGGETICAILRTGERVARAASRLVLQPQNHPERVRRWLLDQDYALAAEDLVVQRGRVHAIVVAVPDAGPGSLAIQPGGGTKGSETAVERFALAHGLAGVPGSLLLELGPLLVVDRHPLLRAQLSGKLAYRRALADRLDRLGDGRALSRAESLRTESAWLEGIAAWLSQ